MTTITEVRYIAIYAMESAPSHQDKSKSLTWFTAGVFVTESEAVLNLMTMQSMAYFKIMKVPLPVATTPAERITDDAMPKTTMERLPGGD